jgi:hypothetical protein
MERRQCHSRFGHSSGHTQRRQSRIEFPSTVLAYQKLTVWGTSVIGVTKSTRPLSAIDHAYVGRGVPLNTRRMKCVMVLLTRVRLSDRPCSKLGKMR